MTTAPEPQIPPQGVDVVSYDLHAWQGASRHDILETYDEIRTRCPVAWTPDNGGHYLLTANETIRRCVSDAETFSSAGGVMTPRYPLRMPPLEMDPPQSRTWRNLVQADLSEHAVRANYAEQVTRDVDQLIDAVAGRASFDLVADFAQVLPMQTVAGVIGIRERADELRALVTDLTAAADSPDQVGAVIARLSAVLSEELDAREITSQQDMLGRFHADEAANPELTRDKLVLFVLSLVAAGSTTTISALAAVFELMLTDETRRREALADERVMDAIVEEVLRLSPPVLHFARTTTRDVDIDGVAVPAGSSVVMAYGAGNLDPETFTDPHEFRTPRVQPHLTFGWGIHRCVGSHLAKLQVAIAVRQMFTRIPGLQLAVDPDEIVARVHSGLELSIPTMPVTTNLAIG